MNRPFLIMAVVALLAAGSGYFLANHLGTGKQPSPPMQRAPSVDSLLGERRPDFNHRDIDGGQVSAADFDGQVWLVNFWATWCKPCVDEMPMLSELDGQGVQVIGIALDDEERAGRFARDLSIGYPILVGQADVVMTGRHYGNSTGMLPFSVLIDSDGVVRWAHLGALDRDELLKQVDQLR